MPPGFHIPADTSREHAMTCKFATCHFFSSPVLDIMKLGPQENYLFFPYFYYVQHNCTIATFLEKKKKKSGHKYFCKWQKYKKPENQYL